MLHGPGQTLNSHLNQYNLDMRLIYKTKTPYTYSNNLKRVIAPCYEHIGERPIDLKIKILEREIPK